MQLVDDQLLVGRQRLIVVLPVVGDGNALSVTHPGDRILMTIERALGRLSDRLRLGFADGEIAFEITWNLYP